MVVTVPAPDVVLHVPRLVEMGLEHPRHVRVGVPLRPRHRVGAQVVQGELGFGLQRQARVGREQRVDQRGIGLLERVEEDPVEVEVGDDRGQLRRIRAAAPGAGVPRVEVAEHPDARGVQGVHEGPQAGHLPVVIPLVAAIHPDHGVGVPQHHPVEAAEPCACVGEQPLGGERPGLEVVEQLVPQPHLRHHVAAGRPLPRAGVARRVVGVAAPSLLAPALQGGAPGVPLRRVVRRDEDLGLIQAGQVGVRGERDGRRRVDRAGDEGIQRACGRLRCDGHDSFFGAVSAGATGQGRAACTSARVGMASWAPGLVTVNADATAASVAASW